jgi:hypothetical protein
MQTMDVKQIRVKVIPSKLANEFVRKYHYSGKVVPNSKLHFGCFYNNILHGVLSFGSPLKKSGVIGLVKNTGWNGFVELNRMAFDDVLPKNSESRCLSVAFRLIKTKAPHIKWILSFSDGTQSGDGTIYRASGFVLTQIKQNSQLRLNPKTNKPMQSMQAFHLGLTKDFLKWDKLKGFQLRYIYLLDKTCKITVPILPFSKIDEMGAGMYKGVKITQALRHADLAQSSAVGFQSTGGGQTDQSAQKI